MQLSLIEIVVLAVVQGLTEFLPVSSSGHLVILARFLTPDGQSQALDISDLNIVLHGGTLVSILIVYFRRIARLLGDDRPLIGRLVVATIPAVAIGLPLKKFAEQSVLSNPLLAGFLLVVTGVMLLAAARISRRKAFLRGESSRGASSPGAASSGELSPQKTSPEATSPKKSSAEEASGGDSPGRLIEYREITYRQSFLIGLSQAAAILPGLSRSGATISTGLSLGLQPASASTFSFLMAIPVIGGACLLELVSLAGESELTTPLAHLAIGAAVACGVGLGALNWLLRWIERGQLQWFAAWCIPLGIGVVIWQLSR